MQFSTAQKVIENQGLIAYCTGDGKVIMTQDPKAGTIVKKGSSITLIVNNHQSVSKDQYRTVPNVIGLPLRRAINRLEFEGFLSRCSGSGIVTSQSPEPGIVASEKTVVSLVCEKQKDTASR
jgi:beta-lactam-binding protein with PASTA domain